MTFDCMVLGAGMVGVSTAIHLQRRGRSVVLVDRQAPAEETSSGNAGLIQTEGVAAYTFPRDVKKLLQYAFNLHPEAHFHYSAMPEVLGWIYQYWRHGSPVQAKATAEALFPLISNCLEAHEDLIKASNQTHLVRYGGYLKGFRTQAALDVAAAAQQIVKNDFGVPFEVRDAAGLQEMEPHINGMVGAIHLTGPARVIDPGALGKGYADHFTAEGGTFQIADATTLERDGKGWRITTPDGTTQAREAIVTLGIWSRELLAGLGVNVPLIAKRGYHMHYGANGNATLNHPILDAEYGYVLAPMQQGIRLTTGAEFARRTAGPTPVQLGKAEPHAREIFPLGERRDTEAWMGRRPCLPDLLPIIGPIPAQEGLWGNFGHQHLGFTLGPVTGRLLAQVMTGERPEADLSAYRCARFQ